MGFSLIKKTLILISAAGLISLSIVSPVRSQGSAVEMLLQQILQRVNNLPQSLEELGKFMKAWMDPDSSTTSAAMVGVFSQMGEALNTNQDTQIGMQSAFNNYLLSNDGGNVQAMNMGTALTGKPPTPQTMKYANDLVYSSLLGVPFYAKDPRENMDFARNYILNASGSNIYHEMPTGRPGTEVSRRRYMALYNTLIAATTFNNYVLSRNYVDKNQFNDLQKTLITQATNADSWFKEVGGENIGFVLRQLLMYQSQMFVLMTQMLQLQKQMVSAQAMNTAVMIANAQLTEASMAAYAKGDQPQF